MKLALYRKYRPQRFDELVGQQHVKDVLVNAVLKDRIGHAYLMTGPRGTGKTSTARILARAINCTDLKDGEPCNACDFCVESFDGGFTDLIEIDAASHGTVEEARDLVEKATFAPHKAKKKIYIIDEVHMLSRAAFNALLKLIEEPPEHVHFILATTESHKVLDTIKSRCQRFDFHLLNDSEIVSHLEFVLEKEGVSFQKEALILVAQNGRGSVRDSLSLLEQVIVSGKLTYENVISTLGLANYEVVKRFVECLEDTRQTEALSIVQDLYSEGVDLFQFTSAVLGHLRYRLLDSVERNVSPLVLKPMLRMIEVFLGSLEQQRDPIIAQLPLETAVVELCFRSTSFSTGLSVPDSCGIVMEDDGVGEKEAKEKIEKVFEGGRKTEAGVSENIDVQEIFTMVPSAGLRQLLRNASVSRRGDGLVLSVDSAFAAKNISVPENMGSIKAALESKNVSFSAITVEVAVDEVLSESSVKKIFG